MVEEITIRDIVNAIEEVAPRRLQESFDNTGLQCGTLDRFCTGVLLCVDLTYDIVMEAKERGCNLIITHHPLLFHAIKRVDGEGRVQEALVAAIVNDITVYSCHTAIDNAPEGISYMMAHKLGLGNLSVLEERHDDTLGAVGSGVIGELPEPMSRREFVEHVKKTFGSPVTRCSDPHTGRDTEPVSLVALCGGAGGFLLDKAVEMGVDAYVTSDCKYNQFLDYAYELFLVDIGHYESEECAKEIFYHIITKKFPNFAVYNSQVEQNPIKYL